MQRPAAIAFSNTSGTQTMYILDAGSYNIRNVSSTGVIGTFYSFDSTYTNLRTMTADAAGNLYVGG